MAVKVKGINEEGKEIIKTIDDGLYSSYIAMGWEPVKDKKPSVILSKEPIKISKDKEEDEEIKDGR
jgi:hypothetical protein